MAKNELVFDLVMKMSPDHLSATLEVLDHFGICNIDSLCQCTRKQLEEAGLPATIADEMELVLRESYRRILAFGAVDGIISVEHDLVETGEMSEGSGRPGTGAPPRGLGDSRR